MLGFGKVGKFFGAGAQAVVKEMNADQQQNLDFFEAAASSGAIVATIDGNADNAERNKLISSITKNKLLGKLYTGPQIEAIVANQIDKAADGAGRAELIDELKDLAKHPNAKDLQKQCYLIAKDVAKTDGNIGEKEAKALAVIAQILNVNEAEISLLDFD